MSKKVSILGSGESGVGAAILAKKNGWEVYVSDMGKIKQKYVEELKKEKILYEEENHDETIILKSDLVIKSPGIPDASAIVKKVRTKGIELISEIEFAYRNTDAKIIAITGSNGKTTTAMLTYHILKEDNFDVCLAGNIGDSFARQVAKETHEYYVLELSSFQLDDIVHFRPYIAILLNITPDHLDRYDYKFEKYRDSKLRIAMNQTERDYFIYDADDEGNLEGLKNNKVNSIKIPYGENIEPNTGIYGKIQEDTFMINNENINIIMKKEDMKIQGNHNVRNSLASGLAATMVKVRRESVNRAFASFDAVEHRLEKVNVVKGIKFINDSKATNVNATFHALNTTKKSVVWIVGGLDKGNDYSDLLPLVREKVRAIICLGKDNTKLTKVFGNEVDFFTETISMKDAVETSNEIARKGETVLLSPACASYDLFDGYEDRGNKFKKEVNLLNGN